MGIWAWLLESPAPTPPFGLFFKSMHYEMHVPVSRVLVIRLPTALHPGQVSASAYKQHARSRFG